MITKQHTIDDRIVSKDGRLTEPSNGVKYDIRAMLVKVKELKRSLTEDEAKEFIVN